jgi:hypothetical protein
MALDDGIANEYGRQRSWPNPGMFHPSVCLENSGNHENSSVIMASVPAGTPTEHLRNTSQGFYLYINLFSCAYCNAYYASINEMGRACGTNGGEEECI